MAIKTFTVGEVLTASDTNTYLANAGLVYVTSTTVTNAAAIQINNCFTSSFDQYQLRWRFTYPTAGTGILYMRLVDGTTPDQSNLYYYHTWSSNNAGAAVGFAYTGPVTAGVIGLTGTIMSTGYAEVFSPQIAEATTWLSNADGWSTTDNFRYNLSGILNTTSTYEGVQVYSSANLTGTLSVYGYRKA